MVLLRLKNRRIGKLSVICDNYRRLRTRFGGLMHDLGYNLASSVHV